MTKLDKEMDFVISFHKKKTTTTLNLAKCETTVHTHDVFCPLIQAWHVNCPITLSNYKYDVYTVPIHAQIGLVIKPITFKNCHSFGYKVVYKALWLYCGW